MATRKKRAERSTASGAAGERERRKATAELRALAHPLRLRLFELFVEKPRTTMQVAEILGEPPTRLYHHVNALQKAGLLHLKETRPNRGTVEKYFEAVPPTLKGVRAGMLKTPSGRQSVRAMAATVFEQARQDLFAEMRDLRKKQPPPMLLRMLLGATPAKAAKIHHRLLELVKQLKAECRAEDESGGESAALAENEERWALTIAFARSWPPRKSEPEA